MTQDVTLGVYRETDNGDYEFLTEYGWVHECYSDFIYSFYGE